MIDKVYGINLTSLIDNNNEQNKKAFWGMWIK